MESTSARNAPGLKAQLRDPERYFLFRSAESFSVKFASPTVTNADMREIGIIPTQVMTSDAKTTWIIDLYRSNGSRGRRAGQVRILFEKNRVSEIQVPSCVGELLPIPLLRQYAAILGNSVIDVRHNRSALDEKANVQLDAVSFPTASEYRRIFGEPDSEKLDGDMKVFRYDIRTGAPGDKGGFKFGVELRFSKIIGTFMSGMLKGADFSVVFSDSDIYIGR